MRFEEASAVEHVLAQFGLIEAALHGAALIVVAGIAADIFGRLFDRFPNLKLIFGEYEVSWLPLFMFRLKQIEGAFGRVMNLCAAQAHCRGIYGHAGVAYLRRRPLCRPCLGHPRAPIQIIWGSDFPHLRNTFPRTHEIMEDILSDLPPKVQADISALTCARLYDIELPDEAYAVAAE